MGFRVGLQVGGVCQRRNVVRRVCQFFLCGLSTDPPARPPACPPLLLRSAGVGDGGADLWERMQERYMRDGDAGAGAGGELQIREREAAAGGTGGG